jgi:hypothetical protein
MPQSTINDMPELEASHSVVESFGGSDTCEGCDELR